MFFRDNEDDIARRKAENDDRSMFFHSDEEDDEDESLFWSSKNKISYDELYGGETGKRIFENTAKRFEKKIIIQILKIKIQTCGEQIKGKNITI